MEYIFEQQQLSSIMYKTINESNHNSYISNLSDNIFSNINRFRATRILNADLINKKYECFLLKGG